MSSGNSRCIYKKSFCNEEGQVYSNNGTLKKNRICRCDYTRGYDFVVRPNRRCYCEPSEEDCSCYLKLCSSDEMLSPDYECIKKNEWKSSFNCKPFALDMLPGVIKITSTLYQSDWSNIPVKNGEASVAAVLLTLFLSLMIII
ncbi:uncharacterized protein LOC143043715 [Mytilus galloprovincialis]|uniref:uncharacterized protein LOC143043715 n=1 Tax=Mytilus galloprovincialis TaxID=29158 RepID=UPI003F7CADF8